MQQNNKHRAINLLEQQKRSARHKLIGSIFLLLIALNVLLYITTKNYQTATIKNNVSIIFNDDNSNTPKYKINNNQIIQKNTDDVLLANKPLPAEKNNNQNSTESLSAFNTDESLVTIKAIKQDKGTNNADNNLSHAASNDDITKNIINNLDNNSVGNKNSTKINVAIDNQIINFKPKIITQKFINNQDPSDILNAKVNDVNFKEKYFIQIFASNNQDTVIKFKNLLLQQNILNKYSYTIAKIITESNVAIYLLKVGSFPNKNIANSELSSFYTYFTPLNPQSHKVNKHDADIN